MDRFVVVAVLLGALISYNGARGLESSSGTTQAPLRVSLSDLEAGRLPVNPHLRVGRHWAMHQELLLAYEADHEDERTELDAVYYPIVATDHAYFRERDALAARYRGAQHIPAHREPELQGFRVLVRTERYRSIESLPDPEWASVESVTGMIINRVRPLRDDEVDLVRAKFPLVDPTALLILEEGRAPASIGSSYARIGGGMLVALSPFALLAVRARRSESQSSDDALPSDSPSSSDSDASEAPTRSACASASDFRKA